MLRIGCLCPEWASSNRHLHLFGDNSLRTFMLRMGYLCPEWASSDRHFGTSSIVRRWAWPTSSQWQYRPENTSASGFRTLHLFGDNSYRAFMLRMVNIIREYEETFPAWHASDTAKLYSPAIFVKKRRPEATGSEDLFVSLQS